MVSIKCQSQYNALTLAGGSLPLPKAGGRAGAVWGQAPPEHGPRPLRTGQSRSRGPQCGRPGRGAGAASPEAAGAGPGG